MVITTIIHPVIVTTTYKNHLVPGRYKALHTRYIMDIMDV